MAEQLNAVAARNNIALLVDADAKAPRTLLGNVWLRPDVSGLKLVHVWDVLNDKGERINRVRGEEADRSGGVGDRAVVGHHRDASRGDRGNAIGALMARRPSDGATGRWQRVLALRGQLAKRPIVG